MYMYQVTYDFSIFLASSNKGEKPGDCPPVEKGNALTCKTQCRRDAHCNVNEKCCFTGCTKTCVSPGKTAVVVGLNFFGLAESNYKTRPKGPIKSTSGLPPQTNHTTVSRCRHCDGEVVIHSTNANYLPDFIEQNSGTSESFFTQCAI